MNFSENEAHFEIYRSKNEHFARRCRHYKSKDSKAESFIKFKLDKKDIFQKIYSSWKGKREKILFVLRKLIYR